MNLLKPRCAYPCRSHTTKTVLCTCFVLLQVVMCTADEPASLRLVPTDAAYYSVSAHLREQYDTLLKSRAAAKVLEMPIVQTGLAMARAKWNDPEGDFAPFKAIFEQPENRRLADVLVDAVSHEVFIYGDKDCVAFLKAYKEISRSNQAVMRELNVAEAPEAAEELVKKLSSVIAQNLGQAKVPDTVIGFRLSDTESALAQLARFEQILGEYLANYPDLKRRLSRQQFAGGDFLTMQLDGTLIPWDKLARTTSFDLDEIQGKVSKMTASVAIGVKDQYLLVSIGDSNDHLGALGQGEVLADRKELMPLRQQKQQQICSVCYVSEAFAQQMNAAEQRLDQIDSLANQLLPMSELDASLQQQIGSDVRGLVADLKQMIPKSGAMTTFTFWHDRGYEGYTYNWSENLSLDGSQPLTILEHSGGSPILVIARRKSYTPEAYETISKWIGRALFFGETIGVGYLGPNEREFYQRVRGDLAELIKQLDQINRDKLVSAFRDGQGALVLDAQAASQQWHAMLPVSDRSIPMLDIALVYGVSDAASVKDAATGYFQILQKVIDTLHNAEPTTIPDFPLPLPDTREFPDGSVYYYHLPQELGFDKQVSPNAGLSEDTLVLSVVPKTTVRLLRKTPFSHPGIISQHQGAASSACYFGFARLIEAIAPWVDYGIEISGEGVEEDILDQIHVGLEVAKCLRDVSAITYQQDDVWITHFSMHLEDLTE
ncbi:MAG: hypothetical protein H6822_27200 [Planctomycetaceae bacterium]|nr:hypothetical protein [Planctomycetales bacterium]MCB9925866.1 hypothetical protein [Planctomycetaceae bacterium]